MGKKLKLGPLDHLGYGDDNQLLPQSSPALTDVLGYSSEDSSPSPVEGPTPSEQYTPGYLAGSSLKDRLAQTQDGWDQFGNFFEQTGVGALTGTVEAASYLLDFEQHFNWLKGQETDYNNFAAETMQKLKEENKDLFPVYLSDENEGFEPSSAEWWAHHGGEGLGTVLGLLVPGLGAAKLGKLAGLGKTGQAVSATVASRTAESTMEANQVFEETYKDLVSKGTPSEQARELAGKSATKVWNTNWIFAVQDFAAYSTVLKGFNSTSKGKKGLGLNQFLMQSAAEGGEEAGQYIVAEEAKRLAFDVNADYFGDGFNKRLADYIDDDEFKTSVLLGAAGGGLFHVAGKAGDKLTDVGQGTYVQRAKDKVLNLVKRGLQKEKANYVDDKATSQKVTDITLTEKLVNRVLNEGKYNEYIAELEDQKKTPDLPGEVRKTLDDHVDDANFIVTEEAKLKTGVVPPAMHKPILLTMLEQKQTARLGKQLSDEIEKTEQQLIKDNDLDISLQPLKKLQISAEGYKRLAAKQPQFAEKASQVEKAFQEAYRATALAFTGVDPAKALRTNQDETLFNQAFQLVSTNEKQIALKNDVETLKSPEGTAAYLAKQKEKAEVEVAKQALTNPDAKREDIEALMTNTATDPAKEILAAKLAEFNDIDQQVNQANNIKALEDVNPEDLYLDPEQDEDIDVLLANSVSPETNVDDLVQQAFAGGLNPEQKKKWFGPEVSKEMLSQLELETPKETPKKPKEKKTNQIARTEQLKQALTITGFLRQYEVDKDNNPIFDKTSRKKPTLWWDNTDPANPVQRPVTEMFETVNGLLYKDSPLLKEGDAVVVKVENEWPFTFSKGYKPTNRQNQVLNVYRLTDAGRQASKPLFQIPSDRGTDPTLTKFRETVINAGQVTTTIASKSVGDFRKAPNMNTIDILEIDFQDDKLKRTTHKPILGFVDFNGEPQAPNLEVMEGMTEAIAEQVRATKDLPRLNNLTDIKGSIITFRTTPKGDKRIAMLHPRKMNADELGWLRNNMSTMIMTNDLQLDDVIYIPKHGYQLYHTTEENRLTKLKSSKRLHLVELGKNHKEILFPLVGKNKKAVFVAVEAQGSNPQLNQFLKGENFEFTIIKETGERGEKISVSDPKNDAFKIATMVTLMNDLVNNQFRNISQRHLNSSEQYTDPATGQTFNNHYEFITTTNAVLTDLPGSKVVGSGEDSSYSFDNAGVHLASLEPKPDIQGTADEITIIHGVPAEPGTESKPNVTDDQLLDEAYGPRLREATTPGFSIMTEKEITWFTDRFGEESLQIANTVDRILVAGGVEAFGYYHNALVHLAQFAETGTVYHEAFHFAFDPSLNLISSKMRTNVLTEAKKVYGNLSENKLEEALAEDFRLYLLSGGKQKPAVPKAKNFFQRLLQSIKNLLGFKSSIERIFQHTNNIRLTPEQRKNLVTKALEDPQEPKYRLLPGFERALQEEEAISATTYEIMYIAQELAKAKDVDLLDLFANPGNLNKFFDAAKEKFTNDYNRIQAIPATDRIFEDKVRLKNYSAMGIGENPVGVWESTEKDVTEAGMLKLDFKKKVIRSLNKYGFRVILKNKIVEATPEENQIEGVQQEIDAQEGVTKEQIHDQEHVLRNPINGLSTRLKLFLATIPDPILNKPGEFKKTYFGTPKPISFNVVWTNLSTKLADQPIPSVKLAELAEVDPVMKAVFLELARQKQTGNERLFNEFNTKFNLSSHDFATILTGYTPGEGFYSRLIETNRNSADRTIRRRWREEGIRKNIIQMDGSMDEGNLKKLRALKQQLTTYAEVLKDQTIPYETIKGQFIFYLNELGVTPPEQVFQDIENNPKRKTKDLRDMLIGHNSIRSFVETALNGKDPYETSNGGVLKTLSNKAKVYVSDTRGGTYLNENNDTVFPYNLPSYITEFFRDAKLTPKETVAPFLQDKFYTKNRFLEAIQKDESRARMDLKFISAVREGEQTAKDFGNRTEIDSFTARISSFHNNGVSTTGYFFTGTFADKSKQISIALPKVVTTSEAKNFLMGVLRDTANSELVRINRINKFKGAERKGAPLPQDVKNYAKGNQFLYIPGLNGDAKFQASLANGEIKDFEQLKVQRDQVLEDFIATEYDKFVNYLIDNGIVSRGTDNVLINLTIPDAILDNKTVEDLLKKYFYQDLAWRMEMSKVLQGDRAYYSTDEDYVKRAYQQVTPGLKPYNDPTAPTSVTRMVYSEVTKVNSPEYLVSLAKLIDHKVTEAQVLTGLEKGKSDITAVNTVIQYSKVNKTDAQSLVTTTGWRTIGKQLGVWTADHEEIYQFAWKFGLTVRKAVRDSVQNKRITEEEGKALIKKAGRVLVQPFKPFQYNDKIITLPDGDQWLVKEQFKDSITPLTPELVQVHNGYKSLLQYMSTNKVDIASAYDTVKVGLYGAVNSDLQTPLEEWQKRVVDLNDFRLPQVLPDESKNEVTGTQFHKLIMANIDAKHEYDVNGKKVSGEKLIEQYNNLWAEKIEASAEALRNKLGMGTDFQLSEDPAKKNEQIKNIFTLIEQELISRETNENYQDAIELVKRDALNIDFMMPLAFPTISKKFSRLLVNLFKKGVIQQKMTGTSAVNLADFTVQGGQDLNYITNSSGQVTEAEIGLPIDFFSEIGLNYIEHTDQGRIRWDKLNENQKQALQMILYRIPTSNKSSMTIMRVALLLPPNCNVVMVPGELTKQQGLDFDVDKSQIIRRPLKEGKIDKEHVDTKLFNLYWGILSDNEHVGEMVTPLATTNLENTLAYYKLIGVVEGQANPSIFYSPVSDMRAEAVNKDAKAMIGTASRYNTGHSVIQTIKDHVAVNVTINIDLGGYRLNELGRTHDADGVLISENHGEFQQADLDAAKTPLLGYMNITKVTNPAAHTLIDFGVPKQVVTDFFMQPILKEWNKHYKIAGAKSTDAAFRSLLDTYPAVRSVLVAMKDKKTDHSVTAAELRKNLVIPVDQDTVHAATVLKIFETLLRVAATMNNINNVLSIDTLNDMTGSEALEAITIQKEKAIDPESYVFIAPSVFELDKAPAEAKRIASFYKHGIENAVQLLGQFFPYMNSSYRAVKNYYSRNVITAEDKDSLREIDTWLDYYTMDSSSKLTQSINTQYPQGVTPDPSSRWRFFSTIEEDNSFASHIAKLVKKYPALEKNMLVNSIERTPSTKNNVQLLGVSNTNAYAVKNEMVAGWWELLTAQNPEIKALGVDLVKYAVKTSGFKFGTTSFVDLVPVQFWVQAGIAEQHRMAIKGLTAADAEGNSSTNIDAEGAVTGFVRHNFRTLDRFPTIYTKWRTPKNGDPKYLENTDIKDVKYEAGTKHINTFRVTEHYLKSRLTMPRFIRINDPEISDFRLYEASPADPALFKEVQSAGEKNFFELSADGRRASVTPANQKEHVAPHPWKNVVKVNTQGTTTGYPLFSDAQPGVNTYLSKYITEDKTTADSILPKLIAAETNPEQKKILEILLNNVNKINTPIEISPLNNKAGVFEVTETEDGPVSIIKINPDLNINSDSEMRHIIHHELEHAYSVGVLQNPTSELEVNFTRNIERVRKDALSRLGNIKGLENKYEFIAELASNPEFRSKLRNTGDIWSRILRFFRKLFNMRDTYDKLLDQRYAVIDQVENLQKLSPGQFALEVNEEEKKKPEGKRKIDLMQEMLSSLTARAKRLRHQKQSAKAAGVVANIKTLKTLVATDRAQAITRYLITTDEEVQTLKKSVAIMAQDPAKINAETLIATSEQLGSYSLLDSFSDQIRKNPAEYVPVPAAVPVFLKQLSELRDDVRDLSNRVKDLANIRYTNVVLENTKDKSLNYDKVLSELEVASRDIGWGYHTQTSIGVDSRDLIVKTNAKLIKDAYAESDRQTIQDLYSTEEKSQKVTVRYKDKPKGKDYFQTFAGEFNFRSVGIFKAAKDYEDWLTKRGINKDSITDKFKPIIDQESLSEESDGVRFISPFSTEGKRIRGITANLPNKDPNPDYALRQFYETVVMGYLKSQEDMPVYMRPFTRIPSIQRSFLEGTLRGEWSVVKEKMIDSVKRRFDENDRTAVDENGKPLPGIPIRYVAKQDGKDGRLSPREVSLDVASTVAMAMNEFHLRKNLEKVHADLELGKIIAAEREVLKANKKLDLPGIAGWLTSERETKVLESGEFEKIKGTESQAYKKVEADMRRLLYGAFKQDEGEAKIKGKKFDIAKIADTFLKFTGFKILFGNIAIPLTNAAVGELTMMKEVIGGNVINAKDYAAGKKFYIKVALAAISDLGKRNKETKAGRIIQLFNPVDSERPINSIGVDSTYMRTIIDKMLEGSNIVEFSLAMNATGAVFNRFKATKDGKPVDLFDALEVTKEGKVTLEKGYKYKGKSTIDSKDVDEIRNYILRLYEMMNGVYNRLDSPVAKETIVGRLLTFMRNWLPEGINTRWRTRFFDERLNQQNEGHYLSALVMANNMFSKEGIMKNMVDGLRVLTFFSATDKDLLLLPTELDLSREEKDAIINLREANIRKTLVELYLIAGLTMLMAFGFDEDDDDSYALFMLARVKRELLTFLSPGTAWDVLRSPTVALNTVDGFRKITDDVINSGTALVFGEQQPIYKQGPKKGEQKLPADLMQQFGLGWTNQFDGLDTKTRLIQRGWN